MGKNANRREVLAAGLLLLAGILIRVALSRKAPPTADSIRFLSQANNLSAVKPADLPGDPFSAVPPGYPLFIRAVGWIRPGVPFLLRVQLLLSVLTLLLVWLAARRRSRTAVPSWRSPSWPSTRGSRGSRPSSCPRRSEHSWSR